MNKKLLLLFLIFGLSTATVFADSKINVYLKDALNRSTDNDMIPVYVTFSNQLGLNDFAFISYDTPKQERRKIVIERLMAHSDMTQSRVRSFLNARSADIQDMEVLWIVNAVRFTTRPSVIYSLDAGNYAEINQINLDPQYPSELMIDEIVTPAPFNMLAPEPGIMLMNADDGWALGNR